MRRALLSVLLFSAVAATSGSGQSTNIAVGTRVRIDTVQGRRIVGTLMSETAGAILVAAPNAGTSLIRTASLSRIQTSGGRSHASGAARGIKVGAIVGAGLTTALVGTAFLTSDADYKNPAALLVFAAAGGISGAFYGILIGGLIGAEKWNTVYPVRVGVQPMHNATRLGASIPF